MPRPKNDELTALVEPEQPRSRDQFTFGIVVQSSRIRYRMSRHVAVARRQNGHATTAFDDVVRHLATTAA